MTDVKKEYEPTLKELEKARESLVKSNRRRRQSVIMIKAEILKTSDEIRLYDRRIDDIKRAKIEGS